MQNCQKQDAREDNKLKQKQKKKTEMQEHNNWIQNCKIIINMIASILESWLKNRTITDKMQTWPKQNVNLNWKTVTDVWKQELNAEIKWTKERSG